MIGTPASLNKIRSPHYQTMESRVTSFANFPHLLVDIRTLAVAGLFYTGTGDLCRCFACDGGLKDWSTEDDPVKEHATYFPHCWYIKQLKGEEYMQMRKYEKVNFTFVFIEHVSLVLILNGSFKSRLCLSKMFTRCLARTLV